VIEKRIRVENTHIEGNRRGGDEGRSEGQGRSTGDDCQREENCAGGEGGNEDDFRSKEEMLGATTEFEVHFNLDICVKSRAKGDFGRDIND
jgi:hypothetical protein